MIPQPKQRLLNPEDVAYWFFRINGCSTITNFVVHPDQRGSQRTDVDLQRCVSHTGMKSWLLFLIVLPDISLKRRTTGSGTAQEVGCMPSLQGARRKNLLKL